MSFLSSYLVFWKSSELKNRAESITTFPCGFSVLCWAGTGSLTSDVFICDRSTLLSEGSCNFSSLCVKLISNHTSMKLFQRGKKCYFPSSSAKGGKLPQGWGGHGWASPSLHSPSARGWRWAWRAVSLRSASDNWRNHASVWGKEAVLAWNRRDGRWGKVVDSTWRKQRAWRVLRIGRELCIWKNGSEMTR